MLYYVLVACCPDIYAPQTKILDGGTKRCVCVFEVLFKGVSTRFGIPLIESLFKNAYATIGSTIENSSFGEHNIVVALFQRFSHVVSRFRLHVTLVLL
jgi:hypothetical protein